ncbi:MAG: nucleotide exchange factor GrpE [Armatimonadota bacterium]
MAQDKKKQEPMTPETAADIAEGGAEAPFCIPVPEDMAELRAMLAQCQQELAESKNAYLRAHADFDNFRKRMRAERDQEFGRGSDRVLSDLLPVVDDFERALAAVNEASTVESLKQGNELIYRHLLRLLEKYGIVPMEVEGKPFDPMYHDAELRVPSAAHPEHTVIGQIQRGYLKNGDAFRHAKVAVAVAPETTGED